MTRRICNKCKETKELTDFRKHKGSRDGLHTTCKACEAESLRLWRANNPQKVREQSRRSIAKNAEKRNQQTKNWRKRNPEKTKAYRKEYYQENKEYYKIAHRKFREENPDYYTHYVNGRRARLQTAQGDHTPEEWRALCECHDNRCLACGATNALLSRDHVIPLSLGGANSIDNLQPLCRSCNSTKSAEIIDYRTGASVATG